MESQKTINLPEKTSDNKNLLKKKESIRKKITVITEIKMEKPIISFSINHESIA